jgi:hypothetical protein
MNDKFNESIMRARGRQYVPEAGSNYAAVKAICGTLPPGMTKPTAAQIQAALREHMRRLAAQGARKGGRARAAALTPEQRRESARKAARARWTKAKKK